MLKIWTRMEFDQEEKRFARKIAKSLIQDDLAALKNGCNFSVSLLDIYEDALKNSREMVRDVKSELEVEFLFDYETLGNA